MKLLSISLMVFATIEVGHALTGALPFQSGMRDTIKQMTVHPQSCLTRKIVVSLSVKSSDTRDGLHMGHYVIHSLFGILHSGRLAQRFSNMLLGVVAPLACA